MRSPTTRLTFGAAALIAIGVATFFLIRSESQVSTVTSSVHAFDLQARETADALAELRVGQQAYVAAGQGAAYWMPKVATTLDRVKIAIPWLRQSARSAPGRLALMEAEATVAEFAIVDNRAREYVKSGDQLMAADVIFTEGSGTAATAARQLETARLAEQQALDADGATLRRQQAAALVAAAGVVAAVVLLLVAVPHEKSSPIVRELPIAQPIVPVMEPTAPSRSPSFLTMTADLCTEFGRVRDVEDLKRTLERAAEMMEAKGLIVWLGSTEGADLQPIVGHGYSPRMMVRLPAVPRSAENAAAAAYRTGIQQIVLSKPGRANGAIIAPILTADGCVGALSAELHGGEVSERIQTLATIVAAQLANVFAPSSGSADSEQRKSSLA